MSTPAIPQELIPYLLHQKIDNSSSQHSLVTVNSIFLALIWITTVSRIWVRFRMLRSAGLDDFFIIIALIFATFLSISSIVGESFGLGKHLWNLSPVLTNIPSIVGKITKSLYGAYLAYSTAITFTKFSIMATYVRIFPPGLLRNVVYSTGVIVLCFWISSVFAIIFTCVPVRSAWDYDVKGHCFPIVNFFYASSAFNIVTDILLCAIPIHTLWALNMPKPQRIVLIALFCMGTFACVASILRLTHLHDLGGGVDITYRTVSSLNWSVIEVDTGIVCASISSLRPLAKRLVPAFFTSSSRSSTPNKENTTTITTQSQLAHSRFDSTSRILPQQPAQIVSFRAMVSPPVSNLKPARSGSIASSKSEIFVQRTFEVQRMTMKDLPALPYRPVELRAHTPASRSSSDSDIGVAHGAYTPLSSPEPVALAREEMAQIGIPERVSSLRHSKGKGRPSPLLSPSTVDQKGAAEEVTKSPRSPWRWPMRTLTKGKKEKDDDRKSVVGMFTADLLDFTSSEGEDGGLTSGSGSGSDSEGDGSMGRESVDTTQGVERRQSSESEVTITLAHAVIGDEVLGAEMEYLGDGEGEDADQGQEEGEMKGR